MSVPLTPNRFWNVTPRTVKGLNNLGMGFPLVWGTRAVPAGGLWAGLKYEMPSAGLTETSGQVMLGNVDQICYTE